MLYKLNPPLGEGMLEFVLASAYSSLHSASSSHHPPRESQLRHLVPTNLAHPLIGDTLSHRKVK
jgi:hypothetical protein